MRADALAVRCLESWRTERSLGAVKKLSLVALGLALLISQGAWKVGVGKPRAPRRKVTLYSPNKYSHNMSYTFFNFKKDAWARCGESGDVVGYGLLYVGEYYDWFETCGSRGSRSVIRDLGAHAWRDSFSVPVVEPLPKLKEGETRLLTVDASGANGAKGRDGAPGRPGANGAPGRAGFPADDVPVNVGVATLSPPPPAPPTPKREPVVDSHWVKAVVGHMYVVHVVDDESDYYALFRVEELQRGDNCTITWKIVPAPDATNRSDARTNRK
jgi:hypothetical protein